MHVSFEHCGQSKRLPVNERCPRSGPLRCEQCNEFITTVDVTDAQDWIESQAARKQSLGESGQLASRKQSTQHSDKEIDRDGLSAELAACVLLCPGSFDSWRKAAQGLKGNRGRDLPRHWTGLDKPVEVKYTRYHEAQRGFLLVRPPRETPGRMREEYIDDSYYVLMVGEPYQHSMVGWTDRVGLISDGELNPVPIQRGQRECWGMHWSKLRPMTELVEIAGRGGAIGAIARWLADLGRV